MPEWNAVPQPVVDRVPLGSSDRLDLLFPAESGEDFFGRHGQTVTGFLSSVNRFAGVHSAEKLPNLVNMLKADTKRVGSRLKAIQRHLKLETVDDFAAALNVERSRASGWLNGYNLPPVPIAVDILKRRELKGLTLDWIYLGIADAMPVQLAIKLEALEQGGIQVPSVAPEPEPEPEPRGAKPGHRTASHRPATED